MVGGHGPESAAQLAREGKTRAACPRAPLHPTANHRIRVLTFRQNIGEFAVWCKGVQRGKARYSLS
jgi:hypothetical protein